MTKDLRGLRIGRLVVLRETPERSQSSIIWLCKCDCGKEAKIASRELLHGKNRRGCGSCNDRNHPLYSTWTGIKQRCTNPTNAAWEHYGGRGIQICDEWRLDFLAFVRDMGQKPGPTYSIDRIDVNGNYCKENCRWADAQEQATNQRGLPRKLSAFDLVPIWKSTESVDTLAKKYGVAVQTIRNIRCGHYRRPLMKKLLLEIGIVL